MVLASKANESHGETALLPGIWLNLGTLRAMLSWQREVTGH